MIYVRMADRGLPSILAVSPFLIYDCLNIIFLSFTNGYKSNYSPAQKFVNLIVDSLLIVRSFVAVFEDGKSGDEGPRVPAETTTGHS